MEEPILIGAVLYDPKVSVIWDIIREFFNDNGCPCDVVYFTNYKLQVTSLLKRQIDIAWNSPLAWLDAQRQTGGTCRAIAMRDTDQDRVSHIITRKRSGLTALTALKGRTLAVGARDSPQATLIPIGLAQRAGLEPGRDFTVRRFDVLVGKHGDHVGGELEAFKCLERHQSDACAMLDMNWDRWSRDGTVNCEEFEILATTDRFDHCVFTVRQEFPTALETKWLQVLFSMTYENPRHREMMDMEGLKEWRAGRTSGFGPLCEAVEKQQFFTRGR